MKSLMVGWGLTDLRKKRNIFLLWCNVFRRVARPLQCLIRKSWFDVLGDNVLRRCLARCGLRTDRSKNAINAWMEQPSKMDNDLTETWWSVDKYKKQPPLNSPTRLFRDERSYKINIFFFYLINSIFFLNSK